MSFRLETGKPVGQAIARIISEETESAAGQLTGANGSSRDEAIHEARKSIKKIRGVLRLLDPHLNGACHAQSVRLRNAGRKLSQFRDAAAIIETFDELRERYQEDLGKRRLASIRRALVKRKKLADSRMRSQGVLDRMAASLRSASRRVGAWALPSDGLPSLEPGLKSAYRRSREAMAVARKHPQAKNYHEWRKRAKDHWYQVRLLENLWSEPMFDYEKSLKHLETYLGDYHNLVVLRDIVQQRPSLYGTDTDIELFLKVVDKYQKDLRDAALKEGAGIYRDKPRRYAQRVRKMWEDHRTDPAELPAEQKPASDGQATPAPAAG